MLNIFSRFNETTLLLTLLYLVLLIAGWLLVLKLRNSKRKILVVILLFLSFRFVFFGNPFVWTIYAKLIDSNTIDPRLDMLLLYKVQEKQNIPDNVHFIAIGTSQVHALVGEYIKSHANIRKINLAGLAPNEYSLCNLFYKVRPDTLILYLSDIDFCRVPNYSSLYVLPEQYFGWFSKAKLLQQNYPGKKFECNPYKLFLNDCFPEFKYRLVFRHILVNMLNLDTIDPKQQDTTLKTQIENLRNLKDDGLIEYHVKTFEYFIQEATAKGKTIIICEGKYNPLAMTPKNYLLQQKVRDQLVQLSKKYKHVIYIPIQEQYQLSESDFLDGYHVTKHAGYEWTEYLLNKVIPTLETK